MHKEGPVSVSTARQCSAIPSVHEVISTEFWQARKPELRELIPS